MTDLNVVGSKCGQWMRSWRCYYNANWWHEWMNLKITLIYCAHRKGLMLYFVILNTNNCLTKIHVSFTFCCSFYLRSEVWFHQNSLYSVFPSKSNLCFKIPYSHILRVPMKCPHLAVQLTIYSVFESGTLSKEQNF